LLSITPTNALALPLQNLGGTMRSENMGPSEKELRRLTEKPKGMSIPQGEDKSQKNLELRLI
ncbi:hypothetical protein FRC07_009637, partial [Ceratobasidium sp. 392]